MMPTLLFAAFILALIIAALIAGDEIELPPLPGMTPAETLTEFDA